MVGLPSNDWILRSKTRACHSPATVDEECPLLYATPVDYILDLYIFRHIIN